MAIDITRPYDKLDGAILKTNADLKQMTKDVGTLEKALNIDSGNVDNVRQKYSLLRQQLELNTQKAKDLKQQQENLSLALKSGAITGKEYNQALKVNISDLSKTETETKRLTNTLAKQSEELRKAELTNFTNKLDTAEQKTRKLSQTTALLVGAIAALVFQSIKAGDELDDNAKKYGTTAELLQLETNKYQKVTSAQDGYLQNLKSIGSIMSSITRGRGAAYLGLLQQLGISQDDLKNKTNAEVYDMIYQGLRGITDASERAAISQALLGDSGLDLAMIAGTEESALKALDDALISNGLITNEQAETAGKYADMIDDIKRRVTEFGLKILEFWDSLGPVGQGIVMFVLGLIIALPKIIVFVKLMAGVITVLKAATLGQATATMILSGAALPLIGVLAAIVLVVTLLVNLFGKFKKKTEETTDSVSSMEEKLNNLMKGNLELGSDFEFSTKTMNENNNNRNVTARVDVYGHGDTPVSEEGASKTALMISDNIFKRMNEAWGNSIKG